MSPRNTAEAVYSLMQRTNTHKVVFDIPLQSLVRSVAALAEKDGYHLELVNAPSLQELYPFVYSDTAEDTVDVALYPSPDKPTSPNDLVMYLHSSGSTGLPKPIPQTHLRTLEWIDSGKFQLFECPNLHLI